MRPVVERRKSGVRAPSEDHDDEEYRLTGPERAHLARMKKREMIRWESPKDAYLPTEGTSDKSLDTPECDLGKSYFGIPPSSPQHQIMKKQEHCIAKVGHRTPFENFYQNLRKIDR